MMKKSFIRIEKPFAFLFKPTLVISKVISKICSTMFLLSRRFTSVEQNLVVIRLKEIEIKQAKSLYKLFDDRNFRVVFSCSNNKSIGCFGGLRIIYSKTILSKYLISKASVVIFTGHINVLPIKKHSQSFVYVGQSKLSKKNDRKIDIVIPNEDAITSIKAAVSQIVNFSKFDTLSKFELAVKRFGIKEAFRRVRLSFSELVTNDLLTKWVSNLVIDGIDYNCRLHTRAFLSKFSRLIPVNKNVVVVYNNFNQYSCNIKYIVKELNNNTSKKIIYLIQKESEELNELKNVTQVDCRSVRAIYYLCRARVWIFNSIKNPIQPIKKRKQIFIQTWHGSLGLKRVDPDFIYDKEWLGKAFANGPITDVCVSNSKFETQMYRSTYWANSKIWEIGHPRNDILFSEPENIRRKICDKYGIGYDHSIFLYAPTYREDYAADAYLTDFTLIKDALEKRFKKTFVIAIRYHHWFLKRAPKDVLHKLKIQGVVDVSSHPDMQELLVSADVGCTDYSSWIYDFILTKKPGFIYASDVDQYLSYRGFYYPLDTTPFSIAKDVNQFCDNIRYFNNEEYVGKVNVFLADKGCVDSGNATESFVNRLLNLDRDHV